MRADVNCPDEECTASRTRGEWSDRTSQGAVAEVEVDVEVFARAVGYHPRGDRKSVEAVDNRGDSRAPLRKRVCNCMKLRGLQGCDRKQGSCGIARMSPRRVRPAPRAKGRERGWVVDGWNF